jgi:hypothetical protein
MGPANDAGASTDCVSQAGPKEGRNYRIIQYKGATHRAHLKKDCIQESARSRAPTLFYS